MHDGLHFHSFFPAAERTLARSPVTVGIIANPASGRDIRRLVSHASVFPTAEKANMVQRVFAALGALGVPRAAVSYTHLTLPTILLV